MEFILAPSGRNRMVSNPERLDWLQQAVLYHIYLRSAWLIESRTEEPEKPAALGKLTESEHAPVPCTACVLWNFMCLRASVGCLAKAMHKHPRKELPLTTMQETSAKVKDAETPTIDSQANNRKGKGKGKGANKEHNQIKTETNVNKTKKQQLHPWKNYAAKKQGRRLEEMKSMCGLADGRDQMLDERMHLRPWAISSREHKEEKGGGGEGGRKTQPFHMNDLFGPPHVSSICTCGVRPDPDLIGGRSHVGREQKKREAERRDETSVRD